MSTGAKLLLTCMILESCHLKLKVVCYVCTSLSGRRQVRCKLQGKVDVEKGP